MPSEYFDMEDQREVHFCFGMSINQNRKQSVLTIDQRTNLADVLKRFGMDDCKPLQHQGSLVNGSTRFLMTKKLSTSQNILQ